MQGCYHLNDCEGTRGEDFSHHLVVVLLLESQVEPTAPPLKIPPKLQEGHFRVVFVPTAAAVRVPTCVIFTENNSALLYESSVATKPILALLCHLTLVGELQVDRDLSGAAFLIRGKTG